MLVLGLVVLAHHYRFACLLRQPFEILLVAVRARPQQRIRNIKSIASVLSEALIARKRASMLLDQRILFTYLAEWRAAIVRALRIVLLRCRRCLLR